MWPPKSSKKTRKYSNIIFSSSKPSGETTAKFVFDIKPIEENPKVFKNKEKTAFVIFTKFKDRELFEFTYRKDGEEFFVKDFPDVISSVEKIKKYYPNNQIIIIDSSSPNKDYQRIIKDIDNSIVIEDIDNKNYETGAIIYAFKKYKNCFDSFLFLQDSILLEPEKIKEVNNFNENNFYYHIQECVAGWCDRADFNSETQEWTLDEKNNCVIRPEVFKRGTKNPIFIGSNVSSGLDKDIIKSYAKPFHIVYCNSFLAASKDLEKVLGTNIINICPLPNDKTGACAWERIWSLAFAQANIGYKFLNGAKSINWFKHTNGKSINHTTKFIKYYLGRG
jgi:hypothetical protein